jgi:NitT/TauT family transport system permease protein
VTRSTVARPAPSPDASGSAPGAPPPRSRPGRRPPGARTPGGPKWLVSLVALGLAVLGWAAAARVVDDNILPTPAEVFGRVVDITLSGEAFTHFTSSIGKILAGFALAMLAGLPIGFLMGRSRFLTTYFSMPLFVLGNVPGLTYAVFGLVIFGVGDTGPVIVSALVALPFIAMNVAEGVRSVDGGLLRMCQAFDRGQIDLYRHVYLPAITAFVFVGIRYGFAMAWKVEALTEVFGSDDGVGFMIRRAYQEFQVADMLAWTMLFVLVMVLIERGLARLESRIFAWRKDLA